MIENIHDHYTDEEILKLQIEPDSLRWKEMLEFNDTEIDFLQSLLFYNLTEKVNPDMKNNQRLLKKLDSIKEANETQLNQLLNFRKDLYKFRECDEVACENKYLKDFYTLKQVLTQHFRDFRDLKKMIFIFFGKGFENKFEQKTYFI
ncbi:MAG TPA: hypothetical protein VFM70_08895 [Salinimicrobium sp.]|nr:hypothetical protein [Salinimicrobium sp.]